MTYADDDQIAVEEYERQLSDHDERLAERDRRQDQAPTFVASMQRMGEAFRRFGEALGVPPEHQLYDSTRSPCEWDRLCKASQARSLARRAERNRYDLRAAELKARVYPWLLLLIFLLVLGVAGGIERGLLP